MKNYLRLTVLILAIAATIQAYKKSESADNRVTVVDTERPFSIVAEPGPGI